MPMSNATKKYPTRARISLDLFTSIFLSPKTVLATEEATCKYGGEGGRLGREERRVTGTVGGEFESGCGVRKRWLLCVQGGMLFYSR